ncbi:type III secretion protein [Burkholderia mayonis]|uniref:Type III secretion protein n=2 Tax=Burkholderiaceae TaxID=119060 RepID=A0A1B4FJ87_9BURK|nr:type III secretion protein [Burkholderia mayonis]KVE41583.1 type III secretion protein [Burkholderia sp. BDU5]KVE46912.1 type III secretion protein [Burkholderia mayonis]
MGKTTGAKTMADEQYGRRLQRALGRHVDSIPIVSVLGVLCLIIFPLPIPILDVALALNLTASVLILALSVYIPHALHLSTFPTLLLVATLFRLGLNIATTRQILLNGYAGDIITTFGKLVVGGDVVVGCVVFIIIAIIQFVVVAKGADRVAEVGARFSLDALPGKQMAIDADLRAGMISKADALERRRQLEQTSQFYGAMDGASKFVKGDAIAGLLIAIVNVVGGIVIGTAVNGHALADTARLYTVLTVGDGLVSQIPSLLISFASGILITRVASIDSATAVGADIGTQIASQPRAIFAAAIVAAGFALVPGFPAMAFLGLAAALALLAALIPRLNVMRGGSASARQHWARRDGGANAVVDGDLGVSVPLRVRLGLDLFHRLRPLELDRLLLALRERFRESGVPYPGLTLSADPALPAYGYAVDVDEVPIAADQLELASDDVERARRMPLDVLAGRHRADDEKPVALEAALVERIGEAICSRPWRFLGIQEASYLQDALSRHYPQLVNLLAERIHLFVFRDVLVELLRSGIAIRNTRAIAEGLTKGCAQPNDIDGLVSSARQALSSQISNQWGGAEHCIPIVVLAPELEAILRQKLIVTGQGKFLDLQVDEQHLFVQRVVDGMKEAWCEQRGAVLVTGQDLRRSVEMLVAGGGGRMTVLAVEEISDEIEYRVLHTICVTELEQPGACMSGSVEGFRE